jgi:hypothetical protein
MQTFPPPNSLGLCCCCCFLARSLSLSLSIAQAGLELVILLPLLLKCWDYRCAPLSSLEEPFYLFIFLQALTTSELPKVTECEALISNLMLPKKKKNNKKKKPHKKLKRLIESNVEKAF